MSPYRRRWRVTARDFPPPSLRQVMIVLMCCFGVAAFLGPLPGIAALLGYLVAQGLVFGVLALIVLAQGFRRSSGEGVTGQTHFPHVPRTVTERAEPRRNVAAQP